MYRGVRDGKESVAIKIPRDRGNKLATHNELKVLQMLKSDDERSDYLVEFIGIWFDASVGTNAIIFEFAERGTLLQFVSQLSPDGLTDEKMASLHTLSLQALNLQMEFFKSNRLRLP